MDNANESLYPWERRVQPLFGLLKAFDVSLGRLNCILLFVLCYAKEKTKLGFGTIDMSKKVEM